MWLFAAFIAIPMIEIALFIQVGGWIGLWPTLGIVILTAILGTMLVKTQGRQALADLQRSFSDMNDPTEPLMHGAMILIAGVLLLTPGFFTDALGLALLIPKFRSAVFSFLRARVSVARFQMGRQDPFNDNRRDPFTRPPHGAQRPDVIDGEFHEIDPDKRPTHRPSGWTRH
ncbi:MAG: FxsA family protein [Alphaproteobacteria bacterium]|jgi:UPF0716 protein FxsA